MSNQRWQYKVETVNSFNLSFKPDKGDRIIQDRLTKLGTDGWELVAVRSSDQGYKMFLKRQT